jgi:hypothetical protein
MATNFVTTGLANYTAANPQKALEVVILSGIGLKDHFSIETGVKYMEKIPNITNVDVDISTGAISGYNTGSGSTTILDVTLENRQLKIFETYTKEQLNKTILASLGTKGTDPNELPMETILLALKGKALTLANEKLLWQDTSTKIPAGGVIQQITDASTWTTAGFTSVAFSGIADASILANVAKVKNVMLNSFPEFTNEEMVLAMSPANFQSYSSALYNLSGTVTTQTIGADGRPIEQAYVPGTNIKAVGEIGLSGSNRLILSHPLNIIEVVDLVDESDFLSFIYNPFARWFELAAQYKLGVKVVDAAKIVMSA